MSILIVSPGKELDRWIEALKKEADPSVPVYLPGQVQDPADITFALAWNHPPGFFRQFTNLKAISSFGAGVDHLVKDPQIPAQVTITRIIDPLLSADMAEFALSVVLKHMRRLTRYCRYQAANQWKRHSYLRVKNVRVGIMGTGMIGHHVANYLLQTGFKVSGWSRTPGKEAAYKKYYGKDQLGRFLEGCNILICLLPLTAATGGIIDKHLLSKLPSGAHVINLGRGAHVADNDLIQSIDNGHIDSAHLDVFDPEPLPENHPFWDHPKIDITPHVASLTDPMSVARQVLENYHRLQNGEPLIHTVSRDRGY
ncbi:MAG: 2-hydroxyacid dehydrogenase [Bacteroidales bacterium]